MNQIKIWIFLILALYCHLLPAMQVRENKIVDRQGNEVAAKAYQKIVVLDPALIEMLYLLGGENVIAAIASTTRSKIYPEEKIKNLPNVGTITEPSIEKILSFEPDLVIANGMTVGIKDTLGQLNIPVLVWGANQISEILENIKIAGLISGKEEEAEQLFQACQAKLKNIREVSQNRKKIKGIVLVTVSPMMTFPAKSLPTEVLDVLNVEHIGKNLMGGRPMISPEMLLTYDPDFIAGAMSISDVESIRSANEAIKNTKAYRNNHIFIVDSTKILRGSPRIFSAIEEFAQEIDQIDP